MLRHAAAVALILLIFSADCATPADNVSICFAYTLPILIGVYTGARSTYALALASTCASILGSFVSPPHEFIVATFVANRVIAVAAQWLVAVLIEQHKRNRKVAEAHLEAERLKADIGRRFVRILTHEVVTALTTISGHSYRLAKLAPSITPQEIVVRSQKIREGVDRLEALVNRVQDAAEAEQEDVVVRPDRIETDAFLAGLKDDYEGIPDVRLELRCERAELFGDGDLLRQAVAGLLSNAVKYSSKPATVAVSVTRSERTGGAEIAVADRGCGIPADEIVRVFEPYYRGRNTSGIRGLGLGLYLVKRIAEAHGGEVHIESRLAAGTCVSLHLPDAAPSR